MLQVNTNGILSFREGFAAFSVQSFASGTLNKPLIAPYWIDTDIRSRGEIYYRTSHDVEELEEMSQLLRGSFALPPSFAASYLFVVTYDRVGAVGALENDNRVSYHTECRVSGFPPLIHVRARARDATASDHLFFGSLDFMGLENDV